MGGTQRFSVEGRYSLHRLGGPVRVPSRGHSVTLVGYHGLPLRTVPGDGGVGRVLVAVGMVPL